MRSLPRPEPPPTATAAAARLLRGAALAGLGLAIGAGTLIAAVPAGASTAVQLTAAGRPSSVPPVSAVFPRMGRHASLPAGATDAAPFGQIILPDLLVVAPQGLSPAAIAKIRKLTGVRHVIGFDGGEIKAGRRAVSVIGVRPSQFRAWTPLRTASDQRFWTSLADGRFVASPAARQRLGLRPGVSYQVTGARTVPLTFGRSAPLGVDGIDLLVNSATSRRLGLVHQVAALISAPGDSLSTLTGLRAAVFAYNHADWYVNEVLALAAQYAKAYPAH